MSFKKLTKETLQKRKLRCLIDGPTGGGKTYTALSLAKHLAGPGGLIAVYDTEESADLYHVLRGEGQGEFEFDQDVGVEPFESIKLTTAVNDAVKGNYDVLIIDSLSPFWDYVNETVDAMKIGYPQNWKKGGEMWKAILKQIMGRKIHLICTARADHKMESTKDEQGRTKVVKLAMSANLRKNTEFEFDLVLRMEDYGHTGTIIKSRIKALNGKNWSRPGKEMADVLRNFCLLEEMKRTTHVPLSEKEKEKFQAFADPEEADKYANSFVHELRDGIDGEYLTEGDVGQILEFAMKDKALIQAVQGKLKEYKVTALVRVPAEYYIELMTLVDPNFGKEEAT